jgi:MFS transporter, ACS family, D-galactonate transporter
LITIPTLPNSPTRWQIPAVLAVTVSINYLDRNNPFAERFGAKKSVIAAITAFSIVTLLSAPFGYSFLALIGLRLLLGLGEGVHIPMLSAITSRWFSIKRDAPKNVSQSDYLRSEKARQ